MVVFRTDRLQAVPWRDDHAPAAFPAYSDAEFVRYLGSATTDATVADTRARIARWQQRDGIWAVETRDTGELVGLTLCAPLPGGDGEHEIGWHTLPAQQRRGYAVEVGRGVARHAFTTLGLPEVYAIVDPANEPSLAVARRVGMAELGRTRRYYDGFDAVLFRLSADELA